MKKIDCDVHVRWKSTDELAPYLSEPWLTRLKQGYILYGHNGYPNPDGTYKMDSFPPDGASPGSDPFFTAQDLLDRYDIEKAILIGESSHLAVSNLANADWAAALSSAYNDWFINRWFSADNRYFGSIIVATQDPVKAAREIERVGNHPQFVQVSLGSGSRLPYGNRYFYPIYEAAEKMKLPVAIHPFTDGAGIANPPSPAGYPTYYIEYHTLATTSMQTHLVSMICEGVFQKFPNLKLVLVEGGIGWLPPFLWRLDKNWKGLRREVPWVKQKPSEIVSKHVRLTTQPLDEPENRKHLHQLMDMMPSDDMLLFSSDYPHWDFDNPEKIFRHFSEKLRKKIFYENAAKLYGF